MTSSHNNPVHIGHGFACFFKTNNKEREDRGREREREREKEREKERERERVRESSGRQL